MSAGDTSKYIKVLSDIRAHRPVEAKDFDNALHHAIRVLRDQRPTRRERIAVAIAAGKVACAIPGSHHHAKEITRDSLYVADELIKALDTSHE